MIVLHSMLKCHAYNSGIQRSLCNAIKHDHESNIRVHKFPTITNGWKWNFTTLIALGGIYMRPGRTQTGMNFYWIFATVFMKPRRNAWCLVSGHDMFCQINISLTQKQTGLKFLNPVWDLLSFTWKRYELRSVREFLLSVQHSVHCKAVSCKHYELMPVWIRPGLMPPKAINVVKFHFQPYRIVNSNVAFMIVFDCVTQTSLELYAWHLSMLCKTIMIQLFFPCKMFLVFFLFKFFASGVFITLPSSLAVQFIYFLVDSLNYLVGRKSEVWSLKSEVWSLKSEVGSPKSEVWSLKSEVRSRKSEVWSLKSEVRSRKSEVGSPKSEVWSLKSEVWSPKSEVRSRKSEVGSPFSATVYLSYELRNIDFCGSNYQTDAYFQVSGSANLAECH